MQTTGADSKVVSGRLTVTGTETVITGDWVTKFGTPSGRTGGYVDYPCVSTVYDDSPTPSDPRQTVCVVSVVYDTRVGDSGGPVIMSGYGGVSAVGVHFASFGDDHAPGVWRVGLFAHMSYILNQFYTASSHSYFVDPAYVNPSSPGSAPPSPSLPNAPAHYATITGPAEVGQDMSCHWYSSGNLSDPIYTWYVNGTPVGTNSDLYYSASTSYTLTVRISNSSGVVAWGSKQISVQEGYPQCWDQ